MTDELILRLTPDGFYSAVIPMYGHNSYTQEALAKAIQKYRKQIANKTAMGHIGTYHATAENPEPWNDWSKASHVVVDLSLAAVKITCVIEILNTPYGNILQQYLNDGLLLNYSMVGRGTINSNNIITDYNFLGINVLAAEVDNG